MKLNLRKSKKTLRLVLKFMILVIKFKKNLNIIKI